MQFIDGTRFIISSSSNLVNNLTQGINKIKLHYMDMIIKHAKGVKLNSKIATALLNTQTLKIYFSYVRRIIKESLIQF